MRLLASKGVTSVGGIFIGLALISSLLLFTYTVISLSNYVSNVVDALRLEESRVHKQLAIKSVDDKIYVKVLGANLDDNVYLIALRDSKLPIVEILTSSNDWILIPNNMTAYVENGSLVVVTGDGTPLPIPPNATLSSNDPTLNVGVTCREGPEYKSLGYLDSSLWIVEDNFEVYENGYVKTIHSQLEIVESMLIYPDGIYEKRDYIHIYIPIFSTIKNITVNAYYRVNVTFNVKIVFKPEESRRYIPTFSWKTYVDMGSLPSRRIVYHNGYYWTSYTSKGEPIRVYDVMENTTLGTSSWSITPIQESRAWTYSGDKEVYYLVGSCDTYNLKVSVLLDNPRYVTVLKIVVPTRLLMKLSVLNAQVTIDYMEEVRLNNITYETS